MSAKRKVGTSKEKINGSELTFRIKDKSWKEW